MDGGTHWVVMNIKEITEYFERFGANCPKEIIKVFNEWNLNYMYNSTQYKDLFSVSCRYYFLYYMNDHSMERHIIMLSKCFPILIMI